MMGCAGKRRKRQTLTDLIDEALEDESGDITAEEAREVLVRVESSITTREIKVQCATRV